MNKLFEYQKNAFQHLKKWEVGALFMEAGTGKTRVAVKIANNIKDLNEIIYIAPLRIIKESEFSVKKEIEKCGGFNAPVRYYGVESIGQSDRIFLELQQHMEEDGKRMLIVDESLKIKNSFAKRTKRLLELAPKATYRLILNGTPITRNIVDLWAQMEFLSPLILKMNYAEFINTFCKTTVITKKIGSWVKSQKTIITGYANIDYLYSLIRPYIFESSLSLEVSQNYKTIDFELTDEEIENYLYVKEKYLNYFEYEHVPLLELLQALQHSYCCAFFKKYSLDKLFKTIPEKETVIFCKYIDSQEFCKKNYPNAQILSYGKNSYGLNMQKYRYTIFWDKTWDLAERIQAGRRTYRTGQKNDCICYDLTANTGLDKMIEKNITKKTDMLEYFKKKTKEEIKKLL